MPLRYQIVNPWLWLQGLLIVLALLGHDLLMASQAPIAAVAPATGALHQHSHASSLADVAAALPHGHPQSPHPSTCGIGGMALLQPVDQLGTPDLSAPGVIAGCYFPASAHTRALLW